MARIYLPLVLASALPAVLWAPPPAAAQMPPSVEKRTASSHPATPDGWKQTCIQGPNTGAPSQDCPVLVYGDYTYWVWSDANNDTRMAIVAYDPSGRAVKQWVKPGARYIWEINRDESKQTISFVGQASATITMTWDELAIAPIPNALQVANVDASKLACLFSPQCSVSVADTLGDIPMPPGVTGTGRLQSRTYLGVQGAPGAGKIAYEYRVDLTQAVSSGEVPCVTDLAVDFGPVTQLDYGDPGQPADVFVVNQGGIGKVGLFDAVKVGNAVTLTFNQPVCAGATPGTGLSSFFVGLASTGAPRSVIAKVGWPGLEALNVAARAPTH
jgi:hypothetical protein